MSLQLFYLPLALALPPSIYLVHFEFNTLFQFWIHTELVQDLSFLGLLLNTPSHHRVHHGTSLLSPSHSPSSPSQSQVATGTASTRTTPLSSSCGTGSSEPLLLKQSKWFTVSRLQSGPLIH